MFVTMHFLVDALKDFSKPDFPAGLSSGKDEEIRSASSKGNPEGEQTFKEEDFEALFTEEGFARMTEELSKTFSGLPDVNLDLLQQMSTSSFGASGTDDGILI